MWLGDFAALEAEFQSRLMASGKFREALMLACQNSKGRLWLIGGTVFRTLVSILYGTPVPPETDFDFIVEELEKTITFPENEGWRMKENHYKNPKLVKDGLSVDLVPLATVHSIVRRGVDPTIENVLSGAPLNIQSIAYNCTRRQIVGDIGFHAIQNKIVAVNDHVGAKIQSERKNMTVPDLVHKYATELSFTAQLPE